jgi:hypothetical protein
MGKWVERRGYIHAGSTSYPAQAVGHMLTVPAEDVLLLRYIKALETVDGISDLAESKDKKYVALRDQDKANRGNGDDDEDEDEVPRRPTPSGHLPPVWRALHEQSQRDKAAAAAVAAAAAASAPTSAVLAAATSSVAAAAGVGLSIEPVPVTVPAAHPPPVPAHLPVLTPTQAQSAVTRRSLTVVDLDVGQIDCSSDGKGSSAAADELGMD